MLLFQELWSCFLFCCDGIMPQKGGYLTFYHYNEWRVLDYNFKGDKYIFALDVTP
jgi:hypothetical protein